MQIFRKLTIICYDGESAQRKNRNLSEKKIII